MPTGIGIGIAGARRQNGVASGAAGKARITVRAFAVMLAAAGCVTALVAWFLQPSTITVLVDGRGDTPSLVMERFADLSRRERAPVLIERRTEPDAAARARTMEAGEAELGVFRLDESLPQRASAVAFVEGDLVMVLVRPGVRAARIPDLRDKKVAVLTRHPADAALADGLLDAYRSDVDPQRLSDPALLRAQLESGEIDAAIVIGRPDSAEVRSIVAQIPFPRGGTLTALPVEVEVVRAYQPHVETATLSASVLDPRRGLPAEDVTTITVKRVILANNAVSSSTISALTRYFFERRDQIATSLPQARLLAAPSTTRGATVPTHAGAAEYVDASDLNFLSRYSDLIYLSLCFSGVFGSLWAFVYTRWRFSARGGLTDLVAGIAAAGQRAAGAQDLSELAAVERDLAERVLAVAQDPRFATDTHCMGLLDFTFSAARVAIEARRRELTLLAERAGRKALAVVRPTP